MNASLQSRRSAPSNGALLRASVMLAVALVFGGQAASAQVTTPAMTPAAPVAQSPASPVFMIDGTALAAIRDEGYNRSQVMQTLDHLCNVIGPRLTGSPELKRANEWTRDRLVTWGLQGGTLEPWGPFGKGWTLKRFALHIVAPQGIPLRAQPRSWSPGFEAPFEASLIYLDAQSEADLEKYRGTIKDKVVLIGAPRSITLNFQPFASRFTEAELAQSETLAAGTQLPAGQLAPARGRGGAAPRGGRGEGARTTTPPATSAAPVPAGGRGRGPAGLTAARLLQFASQEGAVLVLDASSRGDGGIISASTASVPWAGESAWSLTAPRFPAQATLAIEDHSRLARMIRLGEKPTIAVDLKVEFHTQDTMCYNTIAEIPGSDLKDQIVMAGAHLDSAHGGTGANDNAAGCAAVMEAVRILKALNLQPRRTIRVALWTGEEQGLLGSRAYVTRHFGGPAGRGGRGGAATPATGAAGTPPTRPPEFEMLSAYYNLDTGSGRIRGIYAQSNEAAAPIFRKWFEPFHDLGATAVTLGNMGQTDHVSFDSAGLPGFQFIQDNLDYMTRTLHSNADVFDRIQSDDMKQMSTILAAFLLNTANMDERLPRKAPAFGRGAGGPRPANN